MYEAVASYTTWVPQNGWVIMENPIKMDELRVLPFFLEAPTSLRKTENAEDQRSGHRSSVLSCVDFF